MAKRDGVHAVLLKERNAAFDEAIKLRAQIARVRPAKWVRGRPTCDGLWLRMGLDTGVVAHLVEDGKTWWRWGDRCYVLGITDPKLDGWVWFGPIPLPPDGEDGRDDEPEWMDPRDG